ncbi:phage tail protein I [Trinickia sp. LjRoot230]|uniref:phage tail protein I n=1 Tax=Trinickia sp. LjRoot230 TaxID=3342288 RepID=UPI003ECF96AE
MTNLLPPNATTLERNVAATNAAIEEIPVPLRDINDPARCAPELLPYLAWARSVDRWDSSWSTATKRSVIAASFFVHKRKGTIGALRRVVEPLGYLIQVREWWQENPVGRRGTFRLNIGVLETGIDDAMYAELERLIDDAKPLTRHLIGLSIAMESRGSVFIGAAAFDGNTLTVYSYVPTEIEVSDAVRAAGATHTVETLTVYP